MSKSGQNPENPEIWPGPQKPGNLAPDPEICQIWDPGNPVSGVRKRPDFGVPGTPKFLAGTPDFVKSGKKWPKSGSVLVDTTETIVAESVLFPRIWDPGIWPFWTPETRILGPRPGPQIWQIRPDPGPGPGSAGTGTLPGKPRKRPNPGNPDFPDFPDSQYNPETKNSQILCFRNLNNYTTSQDGPQLRSEISVRHIHPTSPTPHAC
jgi:hypothetical protein